MKMRAPLSLVQVLFLLLSLNTVIFAQNAANGNFPRIEPDQKAREFLRRGAENSGHSWTLLTEISLWASGGKTSPHLEQIHAAASAMAKTPGFPAQNRAKAEFILEYMHKNLLKSYSFHQSGVDTLLASGHYNCVSSAVLYMLLCKSAGLDVSGVMTRDHAFASVRINGEVIDVETTNPYGFDPGNRKEFHDEFGRLTGFAYVPTRNYRDRQNISPIELVSLIMSNRISELERRNLFTESIPLAADRAALLSGRGQSAAAERPFFGNPRQDLMDRLFNYSAFLLNSGREEDCLRWAAFASPRYPDEKRWHEITMAAANNRITKYIRQNHFSEARNFLEAQKAILDHVSYAQLDTLLLDTELLNRANRIKSAAEGDSVVRVIEEARLNRRIGNSRGIELLNFAVQKTASALAAERDWIAAINYIKSAINRLGSTRELEQSLRSYQSNLAADFHNRFAAAWNRGNFDEAERILNEGLAELPADRQLLADRETVRRYRH